ncbi:MAG: hypothetical protein ACI3XR_00290 [Eubacteriales bacterium]
MQTDLKALLERMMDENDWEPVELVNDKGESARFSQIALLPASVESSKYVDESVEHNFAILQPLNEQNEEIDRPLIVDIRIDEDGQYDMTLIDNQILIHEIMAEYREVRGITPDDLADENDGEDSDENEDSDFADENEEENEQEEEAETDGACDSDGSDEEVKKEKPEKKGFFSRLFGKKDG